MRWAEGDTILFTHKIEREMRNLLIQTSALLFLEFHGRQLMKGGLYNKQHNVNKA